MKGVTSLLQDVFTFILVCKRVKFERTLKGSMSPVSILDSKIRYSETNRGRVEGEYKIKE